MGLGKVSLMLGIFLYRQLSTEYDGGMSLILGALVYNTGGLAKTLSAIAINSSCVNAKRSSSSFLKPVSAPATEASGHYENAEAVRKHPPGNVPREMSKPVSD